MARSESKNQETVVKMTALAIVLAFAISAFGPLAAVGYSVTHASEVVGTLGTTPMPQETMATVPPVLAAVPAPVEPDTIVLQPNETDGKDTTLWAAVGQEGNNYGADTRLWVGRQANGDLNALIQINLSGESKKLLSATLALYIEWQSGASFNCSVHAVNESWDAGTGVASIMAANWTYRTAASMWNTPGGGYRPAPSAYMMETPTNTWMQFNVTQIVDRWMTNVLPNNGFLVRGNSVVGTDDAIGFVSSDNTDANLRPKLILTYAAEITQPVPAQTLTEDEAARSISLSGRGNGTVEHTSGISTTNNNFPFIGTAYNWIRVQYLYNKSQTGAEGVIRGLALNRAILSQVGNYSNFVIRMAHTNLTALTTTYDSNYYGYLIEVFPLQNIFVNSSNKDTWIHFNLNDNFTYDSNYNLLIDISWNGDGGTNVPTQVESVTGRRLYGSGVGPTGTVDEFLTIMKFFIDAVDNAVIDGGTVANTWPFWPTGGPSVRIQLLYNKSYINESGPINKIYFQTTEVTAAQGTFNGLSIRMAHTTNDSLGTYFDPYHIGAWVEVLNSSSYNVTTVGFNEWVGFNLQNAFNYNNIDNLLIDIRWLSASGARVDMATSSLAYDCRAGNDDYNATNTAAGFLDGLLYNMRFVFADSTSLTWSATSSNTALFSAGISGRNLVITPQPNMNGVGTVTLRLTNSNGLFVTQNIPVTITAVNDAPLLAALANLICVEDEPRALNISASITDIDDQIENITVATTSNYDTIVGTLITFTYPEGVTGETITVTVTDMGGLSASQQLVTTVTMVNDEPQLTGFVSAVVCDATVSKQVPLTPTDEETQTGQLKIYTDSQYVSVSGHTLHLLYQKGIGSEHVTIYLVDNLTYGVQNNKSYVLNVTIIDHPEITVHTPTGTAVSVTTAVQVTFDMDMNAVSVQNAFTMMQGVTVINGTFAWPVTNTTVTFTPSDHLANGVYVVRIASTAETLTGIRMLNAFTWNFTAALGTYDGDGDGMPDQYETDNGLDPNVNDAQSDKDNDGMPNLWEYQNGLKANDPSDANQDADGDGATNIEEYVAGTDPNDAESAPTSDSSWIIWVIILVAIVAVVVLALVLMKRKSNPAPEPIIQEQAQDSQEQFSQNLTEEGNSPPPPPGWNPETPQESQPSQPGTP